MSMLKKILSCAMVVCLLVGICVFSAAAEETKLYFTADHSSSNTDGGWWASDLNAVAYGEHGIELSGTNRCIWAFPDTLIEKYPYLHFELDTPETCPKVTYCKFFNTSPEILITDVTGAKCVNLLVELKDQEANGYTYVTVYAKPGETVKVKYMYLSNVDQDGNIYVKPTQPPVPDGMEGHMLRYDLKSYTQDTPDEVYGEGYGWLMSADAVCTPNGKGFSLERAEESELAAVNIAWVVPYEQLEKTPYLVLDIANEGRPDEGPQVSIFCYWEGVVGSAAYFDGIESGYVGANGLNGVNKFNLKYAVDNVKESLHGENGIAIIVALDLSNARSDGTALEPLELTDAYLMGWEAGYEEGGEHYVSTSATTTTTMQQGGSTTTVAQDDADDNNKEEGSPVGVFVAVGIAVIVCVFAVVLVVIKKKKA